MMSDVVRKGDMRLWKLFESNVIRSALDWEI